MRCIRPIRREGATTRRLLREFREKKHATSPLVMLSATELARRIRAREVSSEAVVQAHIEQIQAVNPVLNAVVVERFEVSSHDLHVTRMCRILTPRAQEALREARAADRQVREAADASTLPPFLGVPCSIKECFAVKGMPNTAGLLSRTGEQFRAREDATAVERLRAAGFIPLGLTNLSELCMWYESHNLVYGRTNNPYNVACVCVWPLHGAALAAAYGGSSRWLCTQRGRE